MMVISIMNSNEEFRNAKRVTMLEVYIVRNMKKYILYRTNVSVVKGTNL